MDFFLSNCRQFTPVNPKNEDEELQAYQDHLERTYRLCRVCEAKVRQVLGEQDSKLKQKFLAWKLALFRKSPLISSQDFYPSAEVYLSALSRLVLTTLAIVIWIASLQDTQFAYIPNELANTISPYFQVSAFLDKTPNMYLSVGKTREYGRNRAYYLDLLWWVRA